MKTEWPRVGEIWYHFPTDTITKIQDVNWETKYVRFKWGRTAKSVKTWEFADRYVWRRVAYANGRHAEFLPPPPTLGKKRRQTPFVSAEQRRLELYQMGIK